MVKGLFPRPSPFSLVYCYVNWSIFSSLGRLHTMAPFIIWSVLSPYPYEPSQPGHLHWDQQFSDSWLRRPSLRMAVPFEERCPFCCSQADCLPGILARLPTRASGPRSVQGRPPRSRPAPRSKPRAVQGARQRLSYALSLRTRDTSARGRRLRVPATARGSIPSGAARPRQPIPSSLHGFLRPGRAAAAGGQAERVRQRPPSRDASRVTSDLAGPPSSPAASLPDPAELAEPPRGRRGPRWPVLVQRLAAAALQRPEAPSGPAGLPSPLLPGGVTEAVPERRVSGEWATGGVAVGRSGRGALGRGGAGGGAWFPPSAPFCGCETRK